MAYRVSEARRKEMKEIKYKIKELRNEGHTYKEMSEILNISESMVGNYISVLLLERAVPKIKKVRYSEKELNIVKDMYHNGYSLVETAKKLGNRNAKSVVNMRSNLNRKGLLGKKGRKGQAKELFGDTATELKEMPKEPSELEKLLNNVECSMNSSAEQISVHHKEMLIEILHKVMQ